MRQSIYHHYDQLNRDERHFVDDVFAEVYKLAKGRWSKARGEFDIPLAGDDRVERAVDALARAVIESRAVVS